MQGWYGSNGTGKPSLTGVGGFWEPSRSAPAMPEDVAPEGLARGSGLNVAPERLYQWESFADPDDPSEPYSLQWFLAIEHQRHRGSGRWIPQLLEFNRHAGETLLGLGSGLGTDWLQYARHGAQVIACSQSAAELGLIRRNFQLRRLPGRFVQAEPTAVPLPDASVDVVCLSGVLHQVEDPPRVVAEVHRLLRPGGKVVAVVPAKYSLDWWWSLGWSERLEASAGLLSGPFGMARCLTRFSARRLRKLFVQFEGCRVYKRQLSRRELPWWLRGLPRSWWERLLGRLLILKGFKPVHALGACPQRRAA